MENEKIKKLINFTQTLNLLYVEDEESTRNATLILLKPFFKNIIIAIDGEDGLLKFEENNINIIITDINMPKLNGLDMLEKIIAKDSKLITLVFSAHSDPDFFIRTIDLGVNGYLLKPVDSTQFISTLERSVEKFILEDAYQKSLENINLLRQYHDIADKSTIISKTDLNGLITYVNKNFCDVSGYTQEQLLGKSHNIIRHPDNPKDVYKEMWHTIAVKKQEWNGILKNRSKDGKAYYVKSTIKPILDGDGEVLEYIALRDNISTIMSDKKQLMDKIESSNLSLLALIQIEEFEMLDKFYNIATVDQIEKTFGYEMISHFPNDYVFENIYNLGNGKYALLTDFFKFGRAEINVKKYFNDLVKNIRESILIIDDIEYDLNIIISYAMGKYMLYEDAKCGLDEAIKNNDVVINSNDSSIHEQKTAKNNMDIIKMVKIALDNYKIVSYFQPIINNKTKDIEKYESLVRLIDENDNVLAPYFFLNISKQGNYYNKITQRVLENSFKILEHVNTSVSINISALDIEKENTRDKLYQLLEENIESADRVIFELLEDESVKDFQSIKSFIHKVKKKGVKIAIDDFGAGYSNFERLLNFEPDILKIDGSLVKNIEKNEYSRNVVETIVSFAKKQNIKTVAEFVENENIYNILNELGVDYSQGYYFGKPEEIKFSS